MQEPGGPPLRVVVVVVTAAMRLLMASDLSEGGAEVNESAGLP